MKKQQGNVVLALLVIIGLIAAGYGYVQNIIKLFGISSIDGHIGEVAIRVIGIFTGVVGAVAGYL